MESTKPQPTPVERIKDETREEHRRVESVLENRFFQEQSISRRGFVDLLRMFYGVYRPLEKKLIPGVRRSLKDYEYSNRTKRLARDLRYLGHDPDSVERLTASRVKGSLHLTTRPEVLGCLYVIEGSEMGNRMIRRSLERALDDETLQANSFFHDDAERTGRNWKRFKQRFNHNVTGEGSLRDAITSARATFTLFEDWFV